MKVGLVLHEDLDAEAIGRIAEHAEVAGYDTLWVLEDEPFPTRAPHMVVPFDGALPAPGRPIECSLRALAVAASRTERITLGVSLRNVPFYSPLTVAQSVGALDALAPGRVVIGLGLGYTAAEFQSVSSNVVRAESPAAEFVRALRGICAGSERFSGDHYYIPRASCDRNCSYPIYLTAFAPAAVQRPVELVRAASAIPSATRECLDTLATLGRPDDLGIVVRAQVSSTMEPLPPGRVLFHGTEDQLRADVQAAAEAGAEEIVFDLAAAAHGRTLDEFLARISYLGALVPHAQHVAQQAVA